MKRLLPLAALVLLVAACGDDDDATTPTPPAGPVSVSVDMGDFFFDPETITVAPGARVTLTADNVGGATHTWTLLAAGVEVTNVNQVQSGQILANAEAIAGASATVSFDAPAAGIYQVVCMIAGHIEAGMVGTFIVGG